MRSELILIGVIVFLMLLAGVLGSVFLYLRTQQEQQAERAAVMARQEAELARALAMEEIAALGREGPAEGQSPGELGDPVPEPKPSWSTLREEFARGDEAVRLRVLSVLAEDPPSSGELISLLTGALFDPSPPVRAVAATYLGRYAAEATTAIPALVKALEDDATRPFAAEALVRIGAPARPVLEQRATSAEGELRETISAIRERIEGH